MQLKTMTTVSTEPTGTTDTVLTQRHVQRTAAIRVSLVRPNTKIRMEFSQ